MEKPSDRFIKAAYKRLDKAMPKVSGEDKGHRTERLIKSVYKHMSGTGGAGGSPVKYVKREGSLEDRRRKM